ncbi:hypothetical protein [Nocardia jinanensis]|nr:hypothetical protein [Nocardia jinanensis]
MSLGEVAADLYGVAPGDFVAVRDARARAAGESGDRELAAAITALRKPTVAAWAVNMLVRAAPGDVEALLRLGADLRTAQRQLSGERLRELTRQRRQAVDALAVRAGEVVAGHGRPVSEAVLRQVSETLTAALADTETAERVRAGTLAAAVSYAGFGPVEPDLSVVREEPKPAGTGSPRKTKRTAESAADRDREPRAEARRVREQERARAAETAAQETLAAVEQEARQAADHLGATEARLAELRAELTTVEAQHRFARNADRAARDAVRAATVELERARRRSR